MTMRCSLAGRVARLALAAAIVAVGAEAPAFGRAPERDHVEQTFEGVIDCGAFQDLYVDEETGDLTWYFDAEGRLVRFVVHVSQYSTDVNSLTGLTLHERNHHTSTFDFATGQITLDGAIVHATLPGEGVVIQDVGRLRFSVSPDGALDFAFVAGHHDALIRDRTVCDALA
jgi:hypothetical protein